MQSTTSAPTRFSPQLSLICSSVPVVGCCALVGLLVAVVAGCGGAVSKDSAKQAAPQAVPVAPVELSFDQQLAQVTHGESDEIRVSQSPVGREQLQKLLSQPLLKTLVLDAGVVNDGDVSLLTQLSGLAHLRLRDSPLSDTGFSDLSLGQFDNLLILNLPQAKPTAFGLRALGKLPRLRQLRIAGRQIDDAAVDELAKWPELNSLHLIQPGLTDRSLDTIASMENLASFYIDECPLSDQAWERLFKARPKLHVHINQAHHDLDRHPKH